MSSRKNILLINPWIYDFTAYDFWLKPLGLLYVASLLRKYGNFHLSFIDCLDRHHPSLPKKMKAKPDGRGPFLKEEVEKPGVLDEIPRKYSRYGIPIPLFLQELKQAPRPDLVLLGCTMTYWYPGVQLVVELLRKKFGSLPVALGGVYATLLPKHARQATGVDYVVRGAAEEGIFPILREVFSKDSFTGNQPASLEELPWPAFDLLRDRRSVPLLSSRGCPYRCSFCASSLLSKQFEQRNPSSVAAEVEFHSKHLGTENFAFYDDALLHRKDRHIIPLLKQLAEKRLPVAFHTPNGLHLREIDHELARLLKQANVQSLFLSQESFEERMLERASSKVSTSELEKVLGHLERAGYLRSSVNVYLIVGLPGQDGEQVREDILHVLRLGARPNLAYFSPIPGTDEWKSLVEKGIFAQDADPLLHNKIIFPYLWGDISPEEFDSIKALLNESRRDRQP